MAESGTEQKCECGAVGKKIIVAGDGGFILKGDGWSSKDFRVKEQMTARNKSAGRRQKDHVKPTPSIIPNYKGQETGTWADAQQKAASDGKDTTSYQPLVEKEKVVT
jgi:predicted nucleic acid-binding Zn ribbon protein